MAFGDSPDDARLRDAWRAFCASLADAGDKVFKDYNPANPLQRADGFRFLTQNLGQAFDLALETKDPSHPILHAFCNPHRKLGADAADFTYVQAWIDGHHVYRIHGHIGTARFLNFTVQGPRPDRPNILHEPFGDIPEANLFGHQMVSEPDGSFELYIGGPERGPNWLPTTPGTRKLFIRQGFDRWDEQPARMRIEAVGMTEPRAVADPDEMVAAMGWAENFVTGLMHDWPDFTFKHGGSSTGPDNPNRFPPDDPNEAGANAKRGRMAVNMYWRIAPDEALIVSFDPPEGFWMLSNMGSFCSSMDYLYRAVSYTPSRTKVDSDGKIRLILAHDDPGFHNWIDTQGFEVGNLTWRNLLSSAETRLDTLLVKRAELESALPPDSARTSAEERVAQMLERFHGIQRQRYGF